MTRQSRALALASTALSLATLAYAAGGFNIRADRGESRTEFKSPNGEAEVCIIPKHFPGAEDEYPKKAGEKEAKLCAIDFYGKSGPNQDVPTATCPKLFSTNPGLEIEQLPEGMSRDQYFNNECKKEQNRAGEKLAKFKQSISCSYTPSILAYYHVGMALGGSVEVPAAVIRTMDIAEHKKITAFARKFAKDTIAQTWASWSSAEANPASYSRHDRVFTDDSRQIYGALSQNPKGENKYSEINAGLNGFLGSQGWANVRSDKTAAQIAGTTLESAAQKIIQMKDIVNMLVMDYVFAQQDRFGNIAEQDQVYSLVTNDKGKLSVKKDKKKKDTQLQPGQVVVKEMLLKDNDCGMRQDENKVKQNKMLEQIRHMAPKNYKKLMQFAQDVTKPEIAAYLKNELLLTSDDVKDLQNNTIAAAKIIKGLCDAGKLKLDLDLEAHLRGEDQSKNKCE